MRRQGMAAVLAALLAAAPAAAQDMAALKGEGAEVIKAFAGKLQGALKGAMESQGPVAAIGVCKEQAPRIAAEVSADKGWSVSRTSHKLRNTAAAPDAFEQAVLTEFQNRIAKGEKAETLVHAAIVEDSGRRVFRMVKAIPTADLCLTCHGHDLAAPVVEALDQAYPGDSARGFNAGDMRGVFTLKKPL